MSKEVCMSCQACGGRCDQCSLDCCIKNMNNHDEIFYLASQFPNKVYSAEGQLQTESNKIKNELQQKQIFLNGNTCCLSHCEGLLNEMQNKCNEFSNKNKELDYKIEAEKKSFKQEEKNMADEYNEKINCLKNFQEKEKSWYDKEIEKEKLKSKELATLKESINDLNKERENIINTNMNEIANNYINEEQPKIEIEFENGKKSIDEKNKIIIPNLVYTEEEKKLENDYLNTINNVKNYSDKIPYFDNWIAMYDLKKFIN